MLEKLQNEKVREDLFRTVLALGTFAALPYPEKEFSTLLDFVLVLEWMFTGIWAWSLIFYVQLSGIFWFLSFLLSFLLLLKLQMYLPTTLFVMWFLLKQMRENRLAKQKLRGPLSMVALALIFSSVSARAQGTLTEAELKKMEASTTQSPSKKKKKTDDPQATAPIDVKKFENMDDLSGLSKKEKEAVMNTLPKPADVARDQENEKKKEESEFELPKYLNGYKINDYSSCLVYDQIPWRFASDQRKNRLLLRDKLRHQTEKVLKEWEIYQIMDRDGYVTYVFRNQMAPKTYDSIVVKDTVYNRFIESPKNRKAIDFQDLKTLVNRPALTFYSRDGGTISLVPSSIGKSALVIQLAKAEGRAIPPMFIRGSACDRPDDEENSDRNAKENVGPTVPAPKK